MARRGICLIVFMFRIVMGDNRNITYYDSFSGKPIAQEEYEQHVVENNTLYHHQYHPSEFPGNIPKDFIMVPRFADHDPRINKSANYSEATVVRPSSSQAEPDFLFGSWLHIQKIRLCRFPHNVFPHRRVSDKSRLTSWCTNAPQECDPAEWRRVDGSCNNLEHPSVGMPHTPPVRILLPMFSGNSQQGYGPRNSKCGQPLSLERYLRTGLLPDGRAPDQNFTQLLTHLLIFTVFDVISVESPVNKPNCCLPEGKLDPDCIQIKIPEDDPVLRFSNIRCMKLTKPLAYQSRGCLNQNTTPEWIVTSTPTFDLSQVYGLNLEVLNAKGRLFEDGLLKYELDAGRMWPPSFKTGCNEVCHNNEPPHETRCHDTPDLISNSFAGGNLFSIWFWRLHNYIATELENVNPCWNDEKLFYTARDINIAFMVQILFYELFPALMGFDNLQRNGIISSSPEPRDTYKSRVLPQISTEYSFILRWFHTIQESEQKMFDAKGCYLKSILLTNMTARTGYLAVDDNIDGITQGTFRQGCGGFDNLVDPDLAELVNGPKEEVSDLTTFDLVRNRDLGLPPYVKYLEICNERLFRTFDDLVGFVKPEMLELLKEKYKNVEDIDLMVGLWTELPAKGSFLPKTMQCLMMEQLARFVVSDRHWYERPNRPHAFSKEQLLEIRKAKVSLLLCYIGDTVTEIQPNGFLKAGPGNEIASCKNIPTIDFEVWRDPACSGYNIHTGNSAVFG